MSNISLAESQQKAAHNKKIKSGRGWILAVSIMQFIATLPFYFLSKHAEDPETATEMQFAAVTVFFIALIFLACWFWAKKHPFPAALTALIIFITVHAADAVLDPSALARGIFIKVLFLIGLSQAVTSAYKLKKAREQSQAYSA